MKPLQSRYNRLKPIKKTLRSANRSGRKRWYVDVRCDCGIKKTVNAGDLVANKVKSCGCLARERSKEIIEKVNKELAVSKKYPGLIHGQSGTRFNTIWKAMLGRCYCKTNHKYKDYGARGIEVEWDDFMSFKKEMYESYLKSVEKHGTKNTTIDRIDNNKNYSLTNCKWSTPKEQANNTRRNQVISFKGKTMTVSQWADYLKIPRSTINSRIHIMKLTRPEDILRVKS